MNLIFRLLLTFNATSLLVIIFLVQKGYVLGHYFDTCSYIVDLPNFISYSAYLAIPILLTGLSIKLSSRLGKDSFDEGDVTTIQHANNSFLPSYLGYFFVALSVNSWETLIFVYSVLFVFTFLSQALYFNPLFLLFRFEFYNITTRNGAAIFLISKNHYKKPDDVILNNVYRINNYTYIEKD